MNMKVCFLVIIIIMTGLLGGCPPPSEDQHNDLGSDPSLVAYYKFNENTGTTAVDSSTFGNTPTIHDSAWAATGHEGSALSFNGTSAYVDVPDSASLDLTSGMTLMAWVNRTAAASHQRIISKPHTSNVAPYNVYSLQFDDANHVRGEVAIGSTQSTVNGTTALATGTWYHLAATFDGTVLKVFVNGVLENTTTVSGDIDTNTMNLNIGCGYYTSATQCFDGTIDEARVYNRALTDTEIATVAAQ